MATFDTAGQLVLTPRQVRDDIDDRPSIVWTGSEYGLLWSSGSTVFARLASDGTPIGETLTLSGHACCVALSWTGNGYGAVYLPSPEGSPFYLHLDAQGQPTMTAVAVGSDRQGPKSLVWNNGEFGLLLEKTSSNLTVPDELFLVRLDLAGQVLASKELVPGEVGTGGTMVWTGLDYRVSWQNSRLSLTRVSAAGDELFSTQPLEPGEGIRIDTPQVYTGGTSVHPSRGPYPSHGMILIDENDIDSGDPIHLVNGPGSSFRPFGMGYSGNEVAVAWRGTWTDGGLYFQVLGCCLVDADGDGYRSCEDCDDTRDDVHPGAPQLCDDRNNDCDDPTWPDSPDAERDLDGDGVAICEGDCDDRQSTVYPGAPQIDCDVLNNDCLEPSWPALLADEADPDGDGLGATCDNCPNVPNTPRFDFEESPTGWTSQSSGAADTWHRAGQTCYGEPLPSTMFVSNGNAGPDCQESVSHEHSRLVSPWLRIPDTTPVQLELDVLSFDEAGECSGNPTKFDWKDLGINTVSDPAVFTTLNDCTPLGDGLGNLLHHNFDVSAWAGQDVRIVIDYNTFDERIGHTLAVDNVLLTAGGIAGQQDSDGDGFGDACDTCVGIRDPGQTDSDADLEGDVCDLDDGAIFLLGDSNTIYWGAESGFESWNVYRGDLATLRFGGGYTQQAGARYCDQPTPVVDDPLTLPAWASVFYLVSGNQAGVENDLGADSAGSPRPNTDPCNP